MTRIVAGTFRGRRLAVPPGHGTRPTADRVREALFNTLDTLTTLPGARFLDLYAGSGAVGLEARSRGAGHVLMVESHPRAARTAGQNIRTLGAGHAVHLVRRQVHALLATAPDAPYDVVFADPPYAHGAEELVAMQRALLAHGWLAVGGLLVLERASRSTPPEWVPMITQVRTRRYGETTLWYGQRS